MAHVSGNATWQDYPSTATLVNATRLENIEKAIDSSNAAGPTYSASGPLLLEAQLTSGYTSVTSADYLLSGNMTAVVDPYSMWSSAFSFYRVILPIAGRYDVVWAWNSSATTGAAAGKVCLNVPNSTSGFTAASTYSIFSGVGAAAAEGTPVRIHQSGAFSAGDALSFEYWSSVTFNMPVNYFGQVRTQIVVQYLGPR